MTKLLLKIWIFSLGGALSLKSTAMVENGIEYPTPITAEKMKINLRVVERLNPRKPNANKMNPKIKVFFRCPF